MSEIYIVGTRNTHLLTDHLLKGLFNFCYYIYIYIDRPKSYLVIQLLSVPREIKRL